MDHVSFGVSPLQDVGSHAKSVYAPKGSGPTFLPATCFIGPQLSSRSVSNLVLN